MEKTTQKYIEGIGRRKTAIARVRLYPDKSKEEFVVNGKNKKDYFNVERHLKALEAPFAATGIKGMAVEVKVSGGGITAQADAIKLGLARALVAYKAETRPELKAKMLLTRDSRMVERKKFGHRKARRSFQWKKR